MTIDQLRNSGNIIFEAIVGSQSYGIATLTSDIDKKGVYIQNMDDILGFGYVGQVNDDKNDQTFYEIKRFFELLQQNNPNILELLSTPEDCIIYKDPIFDMILEHKEKFITKICKNSFGGYAVEQIKKARGLNKKISNPVELERKSVLDFCIVLDQNDDIPLKKYLKKIGADQKNFGLYSIPHIQYTFQAYYSIDPNVVFKGIVSDEETANDISLSSIPKGWKHNFLLYFNKEGYSTYCKHYREYWDWVKYRNPARYNDNISHEGRYDGKNLAHCHRLLDMAIEIGEGKGINVRRNNREELLKIRRGEFEYDELVFSAQEKIKRMDEIFDKSDLPEKIDRSFMHDLLVRMRKHYFYR